MSWFIEDPSPLLYLTIVVQLVLLAALIHTRRVLVIGIMAAVLALLGGVYLIDYLVVTDREEVEAALDEIIVAVADNDQARVLKAIAPDASKLQGQATALMKIVKVESIGIVSGPQIVVNQLMSPPSATAEFSVMVRGKYGNFPGQQLVEVELQFDRIDDEWKATRASYESPTQ